MEVIVVFPIIKFGEKKKSQEITVIQRNKTYAMNTNLHAETTPFHLFTLA